MSGPARFAAGAFGFSLIGFGLILAILGLLLLAACGGGGNDTPAAQTPDPAAVADSIRRNIGPVDCTTRPEVCR